MEGMKTIIILTLSILLSFATLSFSEELEFLFSTDQRIKSEDIRGKTSSEQDISDDSWFSSPPTRLELLTYSLDQFFKKRFEVMWKHDYSKKIDKLFEKTSVGQTSVSLADAEASATFNKENDVFVLGVQIDGLGKPKEPMKNFCDDIINYIDRIFGIPVGYGFQNTFLRSFIFGSYDDTQVLRIVNLLRNNLLIVVSLESVYENEKDRKSRDMYILRGYKFLQEKEIHYSKHAFPLKP